MEGEDLGEAEHLRGHQRHQRVKTQQDNLKQRRNYCRVQEYTECKTIGVEGVSE